MSNSGKGKKKSNLESEFKQKSSVNADVSMSSAGLSSLGGLFDAGYRGKSVEELVELASEITPFKPVRVVRYWIWFDLICSEQVKERYSSAGLQPVMLMADQILYDSTQPESIGNWVRTSLLLKFHSPGAFETRNRIYMMLDEGRRKPVPLAFIASLY